MTINRVPDVPFAQIANSALRDERLSFKARGILALALSNVGEWKAGLSYFVSGSDKDGKDAVQSGLNELTALGYRKVTKVQGADGRWSSIVEWFHTPIEVADYPHDDEEDDDTDDRMDRHPGFPGAGEAGGIRTPSQNTIKNTPPSSSSSVASLLPPPPQSAAATDIQTTEEPTSADDEQGSSGKATPEQYRHFADTIEDADLTGMNPQDAVTKYREWWTRNTGTTLADWQERSIRHRVTSCDRLAALASKGLTPNWDAD
jgi:hypothetical protein